VAKNKEHSSALEEKAGMELSKSVSGPSAEKLKERRKQTPSASHLIDGIIHGDKTALSRAITLIESTADKHQSMAKKVIEACLPHANNSIRIGITGVPGVGKSTFIEQFGKILVKQNHKVAVLAIDPSSSLSKGSILGDKTRMEELVRESNAFIRPSASGDSLGGVARKTREAIILCEAAGFDTIIIETVGVGQSETAVHSMTDFFLLLKLAGAGDELQGIKRGIIEMADAIVINKADGENIKAAKLAKTEFNRALHLYPAKESKWEPRTLLCSAMLNEGIEEVGALIDEYVTKTKTNGYFSMKRKQQNKFWLIQTIENSIKSKFFNNSKVKSELEKQLKAIDANMTTPFQAAEKILNIAAE